MHVVIGVVTILLVVAFVVWTGRGKRGRGTESGHGFNYSGHDGGSHGGGHGGHHG